MNDSELSELIRNRLLNAGAVRVGIAHAEPINSGDREVYDRWISEGCHAAMGYMERNREVRNDPALLLDGLQSIIVCAFSFRPSQFRSSTADMIACYAYGDDYHIVIEELLQPVIDEFRNALGGEWRLCIDSIPIRERYWAVRCGVGYRGLNGAVIVPGYGSMVMLCEILTTLDLHPDSPLESECLKCGQCVARCPGQAIMPHGLVDSRACLSYLTIEHRGEFDETDKMCNIALNSTAGKHALFGCDICLRVCPHNRETPSTRIAALQPRQEIISLTAKDIDKLPDEKIGQLIRRSALKRARVGGLKRNARHCLKK